MLQEMLTNKRAAAATNAQDKQEETETKWVQVKEGTN